MCDQQRLIPACAYAQTDQSLCWSLEYSITNKAAYRTAVGVSKLKRRLHRLVTVYTCQNATVIVGNLMSWLIYLHIEDSDQPRHLFSLIRLVAVRTKKVWTLSYLLSTQRIYDQTGRMTRLI